MKTLLGALLLLTSLVHAKKNVCTVTINSSDERQVFQSQLNSQDFNFIELTELGKSSKSGSSDWFQNACSQNIECDVLIISGHFGGSFFGRSKFSLGLSDLERNSCHNRCPGILQKPQEVFLLGCNTLASKELDHRTPGQYLADLIHHGIDPTEAERIVTARYSPIGSSNRDRMQRIFEGVPFIFGFSSVGPSGKHIKPSLQKYLAEVGDYKKHLELIESGELKSNDLFRQNMKVYTIAIASGIKRNDSTYQVKTNSCALLDEKTPLEDRVGRAGRILEEDPFTYFPVVADFFSQNIDTNIVYNSKERLSELVMRITGKLELKDKLLKISQAGGFGAVLQMDLLKLARTVRWISKEEYAIRAKDVLVSLIRSPSPQAADTFCSIHDQYELAGVEIKRQDFPQEFKFNNRHQVKMLSCSQTQDSTITREILDILKKVSLNTIQQTSRYELFGTLALLPGYEEEITDLFISQLGQSCQHEALSCDDYLKMAIVLKSSGARQISFFNQLRTEYANKPDYLMTMKALVSRNKKLEFEVETALLSDSYKSCPDVDDRCVIWAFTGRTEVQNWVAENLDLKVRTRFADSLIQTIVRSKTPIRLNANLATRLLEKLLTSNSFNSHEYLELTTALGNAELNEEQLQLVRDHIKSLVSKYQYYAASAVRYILIQNRHRIKDLRLEELRPAYRAKCTRRVNAMVCSTEAIE